VTDNFVSSTAPEPVGAFPHAKRVGNLLFLSGIGPRVRGQTTVPGVELDAHGDVRSYDFASQCLAVFQNVRTVVEEAGSRWDDIVDVTVFLTDIKRNFKEFNRLYAQHFATNQPTRTTVEVRRLLDRSDHLQLDGDGGGKAAARVGGRPSPG
jgi:2-aminomuconate deaminase